ncbi:hypothetical protein M427DRAFT_441203 [Gonapodya prolifera JEL478]|uniref:SH3 domain-containing protein n=1 Tax=Gonapodya prolifera (strain JEL478) TaxID=1344416 RepID=A0A139A3E1_GONPJ|nr:hypothetical protein M427DRAFT_441203 [Gonapodya prolifera JEL478]|eukprot:KXS11291.1 hypothetical protein M427DRAFT_441203 [Gonapodya prolifera JEL478]
MVVVVVVRMRRGRELACHFLHTRATHHPQVVEGGRRKVNRMHWFFVQVAGPLNRLNDLSVPYKGTPFLVERDFMPTSEDEIKLRVGGVVNVREVFQDGWAIGDDLTAGLTGVFPLPCLRLSPSSPASPTAGSLWAPPAYDSGSRVASRSAKLGNVNEKNDRKDRKGSAATLVSEAPTPGGQKTAGGSFPVDVRGPSPGASTPTTLYSAHGSSPDAGTSSGVWPFGIAWGGGGHGTASTSSVGGALHVIQSPNSPTSPNSVDSRVSLLGERGMRVVEGMGLYGGAQGQGVGGGTPLYSGPGPGGAGSERSPGQRGQAPSSHQDFSVKPPPLRRDSAGAGFSPGLSAYTPGPQRQRGSSLVDGGGGPFGAFSWDAPERTQADSGSPKNDNSGGSVQPPARTSSRDR